MDKRSKVKGENVLHTVIAREARPKQSLSQDAFIVRDCFVALTMTAL
jgi:hypothetical protein